jgi:hypothetical protein
MAGLGASAPSVAPSPTQISQQVGSIASTATIGILQASANAGTFGGIFGLSAAASIPIVGAAIAGVTLAVIEILNSGCGQSCIETSQWANQAAPLLEQNIQGYFALPAPRSAEAKAQALSNFDAVWNKLVQLCSQPGLSTAGQNCISDRQSGACKWTQTGQPEFPGQPAYGACWNWFNSYRDPIANDPAVVTEITLDPTGAVSSGSSSTISTPLGSIDMGTLILVGGIGALVLGIAGSN